MRRKDLRCPQARLDLVPLKPDVDNLHIRGTMKVLRWIFEEHCMLL